MLPILVYNCWWSETLDTGALEALKIVVELYTHGPLAKCTFGAKGDKGSLPFGALRRASISHPPVLQVVEG